MKNINWAELSTQIILQFIVLGILLFFIQMYYKNKWEPITAAEVLKRENYLNSKKEVYFEAISLLNRYFANIDFTNSNIHKSVRKRGMDYPSETEVNSCFSKLCIYSNDKNIPLTFQKIFLNKDGKVFIIKEMSNIVSLIRADLSYDKIDLDSTKDEYLYIQINMPKDS
jgi:hypothetical protein